MAYIVTNDERYDLKLYKRDPNSPYTYEDAPSIIFKGRPASQAEVKTYRIQKGVNGNSDSIFIKASNLPTEVKPEDQIAFLGKKWIVKSVGYYFDQNLIINPACMSEEQIINRCPKGLNLQ